MNAKDPRGDALRRDKRDAPARFAALRKRADLTHRRTAMAYGAYAVFIVLLFVLVAMG